MCCVMFFLIFNQSILLYDGIPAVVFLISKIQDNITVKLQDIFFNFVYFNGLWTIKKIIYSIFSRLGRRLGSARNRRKRSNI